MVIYRDRYIEVCSLREESWLFGIVKYSMICFGRYYEGKIKKIKTLKFKKVQIKARSNL